MLNEMILQQVVNGIIISSIYALAALGLSLILSTLDVPDFAQGQMYMLGAFISYFLIVKYKWDFFITIAASMIIVALFGIFVEFLVYRKIRYRGHLVIILAATALGIFLENAALIIWGEHVRSIPSRYSMKILQFWGVSVPLIRIIILLIVGILVTGLQIFILKTMWGKATRAVSQNPQSAAMVGINLNRIYSVTFAIGSALGAVTGTLLGILYNVSPTMGFVPVLKAFVVIVLAGLGSVVGLIFGSLILGMSESLGGGFISSAYTDTIAFGILVVTLILRPKGLLGK
jgi:branched-chain amino acid transport system permease protein